jgi:transposase
MRTQLARFVGVDVSKASHEVFLRPDGERHSVPNTDVACVALAERLAQLNPTLIVVEATGGLERRLVRALGQQHLPVAVVNPCRTRNFARALGQLAKTDPIDAALLAHFAEAVRPEPRTVRDDAALERDALETRRRQLVKILALERTHLASAPEVVRGQILAEIAHLEQAISELDARLAAAIAADRELSARRAVFESVKGIGPVTAAMLVTVLPELGQLTHKQIAKLVGVAPMADQSGRVDGPRHCVAGRSDVRTRLYLPTLTATRCNPVIKAFFKRLRAKGKPHKVAMMACMRKLLSILNAMARDNTPWTDRAALSH